MSRIHCIGVAVVVHWRHVIIIENKYWETDFMMDGIEPVLIQLATADITDCGNDNSDSYLVIIIIVIKIVGKMTDSVHIKTDNSEENHRRKE